MSVAEQRAWSAETASRWASLLEDRLAEIGREVALPGAAVEAYLGGGKRLRGRLLFLVAAMCGRTPPDDEVVRYAAFVELVHAGGLCHDDVVDRSACRRSRPSLAAEFGNRAASLVGLHLMMRAYGLVAESERPVRASIARAAAAVASGQADEVADLYRLDVEPDAYLQRCRAKTGALFELAAELGARAAQVEPRTRVALASFGAEVGVAFQLLDDVRDLRGEAVPGRVPGTDLREGVYTLPVLLTGHRRREDGDQLAALLARLREEGDPDRRVSDIVALLVANGSIAETLRLARTALRRARRAARGLPLRVRDGLERYASALTEDLVASFDGRLEP